MQEGIRLGAMVPPGDRAIAAQRSLARALESLGYDDLWAGEVDDADAITTLTLAALDTEGMRVGSAVLPVFTRGPAVLAATASALADLAPGRFVLGLGASSPAIVESWNGLRFDQPRARTRDVVRFLRVALTGARVNESFETFSIRGFRLARPPSVIPPMLVAGLRPAMLHVARDEADGAIVNWCSAEDVPRLRAEIERDQELVVRLFVCPSTDADAVRALARRQITAYLTVPPYAAFQRWIGRGPALEPMWEAWAANDRRAALAAVPDQVVDDLVVHGDPATCADRLISFCEGGATTLAVTPLDGVLDTAQAFAALAPELARIRACASKGLDVPLLQQREGARR